MSNSGEFRTSIDNRIIRRLNQACEFPESGRIVPEFARPEIRELIEWPYRVVYRVHADAIELLSVLHGRQDLRELR
jgi:toxin ParE1/3/4